MVATACNSSSKVMTPIICHVDPNKLHPIIPSFLILGMQPTATVEVLKISTNGLHQMSSKMMEEGTISTTMNIS
jgi:hypothetical protein